MNTLPIPSPGRILLFLADDSKSSQVFALLAHLALQGPLCVLDGGNSFQGYPLARSLRRQTIHYAAVLQQVTLSRVFTCYQLAALFSNLLAGEAFTPQPVLVLDFLATFYDQGVSVRERRRLLEESIRHLRQLSRRVPVAIWVRRPTLVPQEGLEFLDRLQAAFGPVRAPQRAIQPAWQQPQLVAGK